jgi:hypothetical protein
MTMEELMRCTRSVSIELRVLHVHVEAVSEEPYKSLKRALKEP